MTDFYATLDIAPKFFNNRKHFNNSRFLIMWYKNIENAPNIDFIRIPRQNTHSHIILKIQSPNYYYDSVNIKIAMKTTIFNNKNGTAMVCKPICDCVFHQLSNKHFFNGYTFYEYSASSIIQPCWATFFQNLARISIWPDKKSIYRRVPTVHHLHHT